MKKNYYALLTPEAKKRYNEMNKRNYEKRKKENYAKGLTAQGKVRKPYPQRAKMTPEERIEANKRSLLKYRMKLVFEKGLRADGLVRKSPEYKFSTGKTLKEWRRLLKNKEIEYKDLPDKIKSHRIIVDPAVPSLKASVKNETGLTLKQWGEKYNMSRERVRQLKLRWGTINDELMSNREPMPTGRPKTSLSSRKTKGRLPRGRPRTRFKTEEQYRKEQQKKILVNLISKSLLFRWVETIDDVLKIPYNKLLTIHNLGRKKLELIEQIRKEKAA